MGASWPGRLGARSALSACPPPRAPAVARAPRYRCTYSSCASLRRTSRRRALNILGISGFEGAIPFKRAHWPGLDEREYRLSQGHDAAAAAVADGSAVAAVAEERLKRRQRRGGF